MMKGKYPLGKMAHLPLPRPYLSLATCHFKNVMWDFPGGAAVKNLPAIAGDMGSIPCPGRSHMPRSN